MTRSFRLRRVFDGRWATALLVMALGSSLIWLQPRTYTDVRDLVFDGYQRLSPRIYDPAAPVHIIDIDEASLGQFGQWPWPRTLLSAMTERLYAHGAVAVGFDIVFPEADRTSPEQLLTSWARLGNSVDATASHALMQLPAHDRIFAQTVEQGPTVLALAGAATAGAPTLKAGVAVTGRWPDQLTRFPGVLQNISALTAAAHGVGAISLSGSSDGVVRTVPLVVGMGDTLVPALSVELLRVAQGAGGHVLRTTEASGEWGSTVVSAVRLRTGDADIPVEANGHFRLHFSGTQPERVTSFSRVMQSSGHDAELASRIQGKIVLIGASAQGLYDIRATPLESAIPGVTVHAELLEQVIAGHFIIRPDWMPGVEVLLLVLATSVIALLLARERPVWAFAAVLVLSGGAMALGPWLFATRQILFDPLAVALAPLVLFLPGAAIGLIAKERARRAIRHRFAHFVPDDLLMQIESDPDRALTPQGSERILTVMFIDMAGFSTATEGMAPERVVTLVNAFLSEISATLLAHRATIDKFMGDAVMAFWNAPIAQDQHASLALQALDPIHAAAGRASALLTAQGLPPISVRVGINSGAASIGLMGSPARLSYTCLGDSVNLAARLEGLTRLYGVWNCVGPATVASLPPGLVAVSLDCISVKGFRQAVDVFTVLNASTQGLRAFTETLHQARQAYLDRDWDAAERHFTHLAGQPLPECDCRTLADLYRLRIEEWRRQPPPPDWDGSHVAHSK